MGLIIITHRGNYLMLRKTMRAVRYIQYASIIGSQAYISIVRYNMLNPKTGAPLFIDDVYQGAAGGHTRATCCIPWRHVLFFFL